MNLNFPFHFDGRGRTAEAADAEHVRQLIEQVLFTAPGERVNRPTFGCGLRQLVFQPNSDELATASQFVIQSALNQWLGEVIQVEDVKVEREDAALVATIVYTLRRSQQQQVARFSSGG
jgi:phage baseplate assembly protein W